MTLALSSVVWLMLLACTMPGSLRLLRGKGDEHDPTKWAFFLVSAVMLLFNARWLVYPSTPEALTELRWLGICLALYLLALVRYYKRDAV